MDLEKFKSVENEFWEFYRGKQAPLKDIYDYLISLDLQSAVKH